MLDAVAVLNTYFSLILPKMIPNGFEYTVYTIHPCYAPGSLIFLVLIASDCYCKPGKNARNDKIELL